MENFIGPIRRFSCPPCFLFNCYLTDCFAADRCSLCLHCGRLHARLDSLQESMEDWLNCLVILLYVLFKHVIADVEQSRSSHGMRWFATKIDYITLSLQGPWWLFLPANWGGTGYHRWHKGATQVLACLWKNAALTHQHVKKTRDIQKQCSSHVCTEVASLCIGRRAHLLNRPNRTANRRTWSPDSPG